MVYPLETMGYRLNLASFGTNTRTRARGIRGAMSRKPLFYMGFIGLMAPVLLNIA